MKQTFNYNTDVSLWQSQRESYLATPNGGARLTIVDGHISDGMQVLGRFDDDKHAAQTLEAAGFQCVSFNPLQYKAQPDTIKWTEVL